MAPRVDEKYLEEIEKVRTKLQKLPMSKEKAPYFLRLAYASQFSIANYHDGDARTKTTLSDDANNALNTINRIKDDHPTITYPDLYQLAGVVAVQALEGGPKIEFVPGRKDLSISPDESYLPDVKQSASDLGRVFDKVGISEPKHIVALCGGLNLARFGVQSPTLKFDNSYFVELDNKKDPSPTGNALLEDPKFHDCVKRYAMDDKAFIQDYVEAHKKLCELGFKDYEEAHKKPCELGLPPSSFRSALEEKVNITITQRAVGVAVAAAVVIFGVFYLINRRRAKHSSPQF